MHNLQNKYYLTLYSLSEISWITPTSRLSSEGGALIRTQTTAKTATFSCILKCQNSSKSPLFQELENTLLSR